MPTDPGGAEILESYRAIFEQSSDAILIHNESGAIVDANEAASNLLGQSREKLCKQHTSDLHPEIADLIDRAIQTGSAETKLGVDTSEGVKRLEVTVEQIERDQFFVMFSDDTDTFAGKKQLDAIVGNLPVVLFALDPEGTFTMVRGQALQQLGLESSELTGASVFEAYADYPDIVEAAKQALEGKPVRAEQSVDNLIFETQYCPVTNQDGSVQQVIGISLDITDRKQQEKEFQTLLEAVPAGVFMTDGDGTIEFINREARSMVGLDGDGEGKQMGEILDSDQAKSFKHHHADALEQGGPIEREHTFETDAGIRTIEAIVVPVTNSSGETYAVVGVAQDITERKQREKQLERNGIILDQITDTDDIVFWLFDGAFDRLEFINDAYQSVWGQPVERLKKNPTEFIDGVHPEDREHVQQGVEQLRAGESVTLEFRVNPETEYSRWVSVEANPVFGQDGTVERIAGISRDITTRKSREQELKKSNERLEQFAYVASHDLQEPLRTISNYTEVLAEDYSEGLDEEAERFIDVIVTGSERMQSMIDGLLDYSRVTTRGGEFEPVDTNEVVADVSTDLTVMLGEETGTIEWGTLPTVEADADQLRQVVQNLVKNALEHSEEPVAVEIRATDAGDYYRFEVEDDGPGIAHNRQEKIFRIFKSGTQYQTSSQAKGIGLAICDQIVDRHGGEIWVESEPGEGATFVFTIDKERGTNDGEHNQ